MPEFGDMLRRRDTKAETSERGEHADCALDHPELAKPHLPKRPSHQDQRRQLKSTRGHCAQ